MTYEYEYKLTACIWRGASDEKRERESRLEHLGHVVSSVVRLSLAASMSELCLLSIDTR